MRLNKSVFAMTCAQEMPDQAGANEPSNCRMVSWPEWMANQAPWRAREPAATRPAIQGKVIRLASEALTTSCSQAGLDKEQIHKLAAVATLLMDWGLYRERNVVELLVGRLKEYRRIATRYDKLAASYLAFVQLAAVRMWL
jgi:transposase